MNVLRFGDYEFDLISLVLRLNGRPMPLRPKTAAVLRELLLQHGQIISKRKLIIAVWQSEQVADQNLFQAMSELRHSLAPLKPIKTHPNLGYQWIAAVSVVRRPGAMAFAAAISALALAAAIWIGLSLSNQPSNPQTKQSASASLSPVLAAFTSGVVELEAGRVANAEKYFRLSVEENPHFVTARLLLSEALFRQGDINQAKDKAMSLIESGDQHGDAYAVIGAMDLISRSEQASGQDGVAVEWAFEAAHRARSEGFICVAADLDQRLERLLSQLDLATGPALNLIADTERAPERCRQMRPLRNETGQLDSADNVPADCYFAMRQKPLLRRA